MSRIIKKEHGARSDETVTISPIDRPVKRTRGERNRSSLQFKNIIDGMIVQWRDKVARQVTAIERNAADKVDSARKKGYDEGFAAGVAREEARFAQRMDEMLMERFKAIDTLLGEAKRMKEEAFRGMEIRLIEFAVSIAETIIRRNIEADPELVEAAVGEAMSYVINSEQVVLKVSAEDFRTINEKYDHWFGHAGNVKEFRIEIDKRLVPGDCAIETESGLIDATLKSRLEALTEELLKIRT